MKDHFVSIPKLSPFFTERIPSFFFLVLKEQLEERLSSFLTERAFKDVKNKNLGWRELLNEIFQYSRRQIPVQKREVLESSYLKKQQLFNSLNYKKFVQKIRNGEDLNPHLSKGITWKKEDKLLDHYGIVHFHLGDDDFGSYFVKRVKDILYAVVQDSKIYLIGFFPHAKWSDRMPLNIINDEWPELLYKVRNIKTREYTDEEWGVLWARNYNTLPSINGVGVWPKYSMGVTAGKESLKGRFCSIAWSRGIENYYVKAYEQLFCLPNLRLLTDLYITCDLTNRGDLIFILRSRKEGDLTKINLTTLIKFKLKKCISPTWLIAQLKD